MAEQSTATLAAFVLARIADDEERALFVQREVAAGRGPETHQAWRLGWHDEYDLLCIEPERALAECEAKRAIVHQQEAWDQDPTLLWVVHNLALPYASHPEYREEWDWRPPGPHRSRG
ncbi:DUF6221 family protein [Auraticoccus monumenti]|uniref:Uncharacterized protein n=1 Tax=Auraticoccus monumenti TaxID=675864 RepID=A0A1G6UL83_9ACTN|nr:DUF6221 family protein [Auraticoccus monumenti]SDD42014.1 hypothetical protein SAMN04489747_0911 [Auraticoccus monumenti]